MERKFCCPMCGGIDLKERRGFAQCTTKGCGYRTLSGAQWRKQEKERLAKQQAEPPRKRSFRLVVQGGSDSQPRSTADLNAEIARKLAENPSAYMPRRDESEACTPPEPPKPRMPGPGEFRWSSGLFGGTKEIERA